MRIATYNVWNETSNLDRRTEPLIQEIISANADIIGLQEVMPAFWDKLVQGAGYGHYTYHKFRHRADGLAILSKYPLESDVFLDTDDNSPYNSLAQNVTITAEGFRFSIINVHLPWDSMLAREKQTVAINEYLSQQKDHVDYFILLGDFNCSNRSSVHSFLIGEQSLFNCETNPPWHNLAELHASLNGYGVKPTLDFSRNPRWKNNNTTQLPVACDHIYFMDNAIRGDYFVRKVSIFGTGVSPETGISPSDHYGVLAEMDFVE